MSAAAATAACRAGEVLHRAAADLRAAGVDAAALEAEWLLAGAWGCDRSSVLRRVREPLPAAVAAAFDALLQRRVAREPLQYILGAWEFWSLELAVGPAVLIPRPETELLVERALAIAPTLARAERPLRLADIGTGSGCIAIALAKHLPQAEVWATDVSAAALAVARANAARHGVAGRIRFREADLCSGLAAGGFDLVVANPPYVTTAELAALEPELAWEPRAALDGGADGLDVYRRLVPMAAATLRPGGWLLLEIGIEQGEALRALLGGGAWEAVAVRDDLTRRPRLVEARRSAGEG